MRKLLIILFIPVISYTQNITNYKEINIGFPPGASFLWGKTIYYDNNTLLDYEGGLAFPSIGTAKVGYGLGNERFAVILGLRLFPLLNSLQFTFKERFVFSIEISPSVYSTLFWNERIEMTPEGETYLNSEPNYDSVWGEFNHPSMVPAIVTFGWRW